LPSQHVSQRELYPESCRAPDVDYDPLTALKIQQALDEEQLKLLQDSLRTEGVDSGLWAARVLELRERVLARAERISALAAS
jgi:hypothetical protein